MNGSQCLVVPLLFAGSAAAAQEEVALQPTGLQDAAFGMAVMEHDGNSVTITARPSIDTSNRATCRRRVETQRVNNGVRCFFVNTGAIDPGCRINLTLQSGSGNGGHDHTAGRPLGTVAPDTGLGEYSFAYEVPEVAGQVDIVARGIDSNGRAVGPFTFHINVETQGLAQLPPSPNYRFVGAAGSHTLLGHAGAGPEPDRPGRGLPRGLPRPHPWLQ